jgi:hypothetical protein
MKKPGPPTLVVDNKLPTEPSEEFTYEEFKVIAEDLLDVQARYPEIDALLQRARDNDDYAMFLAVTGLCVHYDYWRGVVAEREREKLHVVKKRDP